MHALGIGDEMLVFICYKQAFSILEIRLESYIIHLNLYPLSSVLHNCDDKQERRYEFVGNLTDSLEHAYRFTELIQNSNDVIRNNESLHY